MSRRGRVLRAGQKYSESACARHAERAIPAD